MSNLRTIAFTLLLLTAFHTTAQAQARVISERTEAEVLAARPARATRVLSGVGLGAAGLVVATGIGFGIGGAMRNECSASSFICFQSHAIEGGLVGASVGVALLPALYSLASEWVGGRGHAGGAYLGFLVGSAASAGMISLGVLANERLRNDVGGGLLGASIALGVLAPLAGMALGYEITDDATLPQVQPTVAFDAQGATFGLGGTF